MFNKSGIPTGSLWGNVPHYISESPNPKTSHGLLSRLNTMYELGLNLDDLARSGRRFERQVNEALAQKMACGGLMSAEAQDFITRVRTEIGNRKWAEAQQLLNNASTNDDWTPQENDEVLCLEEYLKALQDPASQRRGSERPNVGGDR